MRRRDIVAALMGGAVVLVLAGGVAWAAIPGPGGVIQGCYDSGGNVKVVEALPCPKSYTPFEWNQQGLPGAKGDKGDNGTDGTDGVSPAVTQLPAGDANCANGGAALTDAFGSTAYVCNGVAGNDGQPFAGTFTSPNGEYSITVADTGITIAHGTASSIELTGDDLIVRSEDIDVQSELTTVLKAGTTATVDAEAKFTLSSSGGGDIHTIGVLDLEGGAININ
jgi:hypothetical protein